MEIFIVKSKFGQIVGVYSTMDKAKKRLERVGGGRIIVTPLDADTMIMDKE